MHLLKLTASLVLFYGSEPVSIFLLQRHLNILLRECLQKRLDGLLGTGDANLVQQAVKDSQVEIKNCLRHL